MNKEFRMIYYDEFWHNIANIPNMKYYRILCTDSDEITTSIVILNVFKIQK